MTKDDLNTEWCLLQNQFDSYEKYSLLIKLTSILVISAAELSATINIFMLFILVILWLQDAIWKTFQSRIEVRLLQLEDYGASESNVTAFKFNSEYQAARLRGLSLITEYARQAIRPTVAFPHIALVLILSYQYLI